MNATESDFAPAESESLAQRAKDCLQSILDRMGTSAEAYIFLDSEEQITIDIRGEELGLLIGSQGETLNALQTLVRTITSNHDLKRIPILLDAQGYRERRASSLREQAGMLRDKVKDTGKEAVVEGLTAYERRIIHMALAEDPDVRTYSEGEGLNRKLIVSPKE